MLTKTIKISAVTLVFGIVAVIAFWKPLTTHANPSSFFSPVKSATATTSPTFLNTAGTFQATSTALDNYTSSGLTFFAYDRNSLMVQMAGSSTAALLNIRYQFSTDGIDWYDDDITSGTSTASVIDVRNPTNYNWLANVTATSSKLLSVPAVTRYVRAVFTESGASAAIWYQWEPVKQNP